MKTLKSWMVVILLGGIAAYAIAEEITLTTYYPSPRGVYDQLRTSGNVQIGRIDPPLNARPPRLHVVQDSASSTDPTLVAPALRVDRRDPQTSDLVPLLDINEQGDLTVSGGGRINGRGSVPTGLIGFFAGECPSGWNEYQAADGRYVVAISGAKADAGTVGSALGNLDAPTFIGDPLPAHSHTVSLSSMMVEGGGGPRPAAPGTYTSSTDSTGTPSGSLNVPYIQLRACIAT